MFRPFFKIYIYNLLHLETVMQKVYFCLRGKGKGGGGGYTPLYLIGIETLSIS